MRSLLKLTLLITLLAGSTMLHASALTFTHLGGTYDYLFTLVNPGDSGVPIYDVYLAIPAADPGVIWTFTDPTARVNPVGWDNDTGGAFFFGVVTPGSPGVFLEWSDFSSLYDIQPGDSGDFGFSATEQLTGDMFYAVNGSIEQQGPVSFDTAVELPEPAGTAAFLAAGLLVIGGLRRAKVAR
jgi:hypothetical protein